MPDANEKLIEHIGKLTQMTNERRIPWYRLNPTVYAWDSNSKNTRTTLQEAVARVRVSTGAIVTRKTYLFQIQDKGQQANSVSVDSKERSEYQEPLKDLYHAAALSIDARTADLLEKLLDDL